MAWANSNDDPLNALLTSFEVLKKKFLSLEKSQVTCFGWDGHDHHYQYCQSGDSFVPPHHMDYYSEWAHYPDASWRDPSQDFHSGYMFTNLDYMDYVDNLTYDFVQPTFVDYGSQHPQPNDDRMTSLEVQLDKILDAVIDMQEVISIKMSEQEDKITMVEERFDQIFMHQAFLIQNIELQLCQLTNVLSRKPHLSLLEEDEDLMVDTVEFEHIAEAEKDEKSEKAIEEVTIDEEMLEFVQLSREFCLNIRELEEEPRGNFWPTDDGESYFLEVDKQNSHHAFVFEALLKAAKIKLEWKLKNHLHGPAILKVKKRKGRRTKARVKMKKP